MVWNKKNVSAVTFWVTGTGDELCFQAPPLAGTDHIPQWPQSRAVVSCRTEAAAVEPFHLENR